MPVANSIHRKMICGMSMGIETSPNSILKSSMEKRTDSVNNRLFRLIKGRGMLINQPSSRITCLLPAHHCVNFIKFAFKCTKNEQKRISMQI